MKNGTAGYITAHDLKFDRDRLRVVLQDEREVSVPLDRYPTLQKAKPTQRKRWRKIGRGIGFHWPEFDLDLMTDQLVQGEPEGFPPPPPMKKTQPADHQARKHHITPKKGMWVVLSEPKTLRQSMGEYLTKLEAEAAARRLARELGGQIIRHRKDGTTQVSLRVKRSGKVASRKTTP